MSPFFFAGPFFPFLLIEVLSLTSYCTYPIPEILILNSYSFPTKSPLFSEGSVFLPGFWTAVLFKTSPPEREASHNSALFFFAMVKAKRMFYKDLQFVRGVGNASITS